MSIVELVREAGVVGAGGAGFPTHAKIDTRADIVIANGAECEPLLRTDQYIMDHYAEELIAGLKLVVNQVAAQHGIIALKRKHRAVVEKLQSLVAQEPNIEVLLLDNVYPTGDEHVLVNLAIRKVVPEGGIPLQVGAVVSNVTTLLNVYYASLGHPVLDRFVTVVGEVQSPAIVKVPVGTMVSELIDAVGGPTIQDYRVIHGGPMMGDVLESLATPVTKLTGGLIVLPSSHKMIVQKTRDLKTQFRKARSACCQCVYCTTMCPRYRLGHNLEPHKVMRALGGSIEDNIEDFTQAYLCTECGICGFYACVHELMPFQANRWVKEKLRDSQTPNPHRRTDITVRDGLMPIGVPTERLLKRVRLGQYEVHGALSVLELQPSVVSIPLRQHIGAPAQAIVQVGDKVERGQLVGEIPGDALGAKVHSTITGYVTEVTDHVVIKS